MQVEQAVQDPVAQVTEKSTEDVKQVAEVSNEKEDQKDVENVAVEEVATKEEKVELPEQPETLDLSTESSSEELNLEESIKGLKDLDLKKNKSSYDDIMAKLDKQAKELE